VFDAYRDIAPIDPGFAERRELWRLHAYLAVVSVEGPGPFGRRYRDRLAGRGPAYRWHGSTWILVPVPVPIFPASASAASSRPTVTAAMRDGFTRPSA
jgi:hypothetical protein